VSITQISRITHRKGLSENLPQLAGAELGWVIDDRELYIGNGTLEDGAPIIGNTKILTEYTDILNLPFTYTYKGEEAGYVVRTGPTSGADITRPLQSKFDDFASVRDFGASGDGSADDTEAINRALFELFAREINPQIRRSLFFPAGVYKVTDTINVPSYAKLYGEGADSSIIRYENTGTLASYVLRTADSKQQTGSNIGIGSATAPTNIEVSSLTIETTAETNIVLVENATNCYFDSVRFKGITGIADLTSASGPACITVLSTTALETTQITFNKCHASDATYGVYIDDNCKGITFSNSKFDTHYQGVVIGESPINGGPTGVRILHNMFDNIAHEGIKIGAVSLNVSAYNVFYDVGNNFVGAGSQVASNINIDNADNASIGDMFQRNDTDNASVPRIYLNEKESIGYDGSKRIKFGSYARDVGKVAPMSDATTGGLLFTISTVDVSDEISAFAIDYTIKRDDTIRYGKITVATAFGVNALSYSEDFTENAPTGVTLFVSQTGADVTVTYDTTSTTIDATISYSLTKLY
jgi:hypothetical protein